MALTPLVKFEVALKILHKQSTYTLIFNLIYLKKKAEREITFAGKIQTQSRRPPHCRFRGNGIIASLLCTIIPLFH